MRNSVKVFIIIVSFCLSGFAMGEDIFSVEPLPSLMNKLNVKEKKYYKEFCQSMTKHHSGLTQLFLSDTTKKQDPENEWGTICAKASGEALLANGLFVFKYKDDAKWFATLLNIFGKLGSDGLKAFNTKIEIDRLTKKKLKSIKYNRKIKKCDADDIDYLDKMVGFSKSLLRAENKNMWLREYKARNSGKDFIQEYLDASMYAINLGHAVMSAEKTATANAKSDEPDRYAGGEKDLESWVIEGEDIYFKNFKLSRNQWQIHMKTQHILYEKMYEAWYDDLQYIFNNTMFDHTDNMRGWKWYTLGVMMMTEYNKILFMKQ